jgi:hypothetical protein
MKKIFCLLAAGIICLVLSGAVAAKTPVKLGFRGGLGTDISGGLAYGVGGNYLLDLGGSSAELGINFYGGNFTETSNNGFHDYTEKTNLFVFGFLANYLLNYSLDDPGLFFVSGVGLGAVNVNWTEESPTDTSLGTLLPGGGSKQSADAFAGGSILNLGIGYLFANGFDVRFEAPVILVFGAPGKATSVAPTFTLTGGFRI